MTTTPKGQTRAHPRALDAALVLLVAIATDGMLGWLVAGLGPTTSVHLAVFVHVVFTIYVGELYGPRRATWFVLIAVYLLSQVVVFLGYGMPFSQLSDWLSAQPIVGPALEAVLRAVPEGTTLSDAMTALVGIALLANVVAMQALTWRTRSVKAWAALIVAGIALAVLVGLLLAALDVPADGGTTLMVDPMLTPATIVPEWYTLHAYAMLRAIPGKLAGVVIVFVAIVLPALAAWFRAERLRIGRARRAWCAACLGLAATWVLLAWQGALTRDGMVIAVSRALTLCWFAFFLVVPFVLRRLQHGGENRADP